MNRTAVAVALVLSFPLHVSPVPAADPLPRAGPESVGLSAGRLARIGQVINAHIEAGRLPGMVMAIARKGRLAHFAA